MLTLTQPTLPPWHSALYLIMIFWFAALVLNASAVAPLSVSGTVTAVLPPLTGCVRVAIPRMVALAADVPPMIATAAASPSSEYRRTLVIVLIPSPTWGYRRPSRRQASEAQPPPAQTGRLF